MVKQIVMDDELHILLKTKASKENKSIKKLVAELVRNYLNIKIENNEDVKDNV